MIDYLYSNLTKIKSNRISVRSVLLKRHLFTKNGVLFLPQKSEPYFSWPRILAILAAPKLHNWQLCISFWRSFRAAGCQYVDRFNTSWRNWASDRMTRKEQNHRKVWDLLIFLTLDCMVVIPRVTNSDEAKIAFRWIASPKFLAWGCAIKAQRLVFYSHEHATPAGRLKQGHFIRIKINVHAVPLGVAFRY